MSEIEWDEMGPLGYPDDSEEDRCPCDLCMGYGDEEPAPFFAEQDERRSVLGVTA